VLKYQHTHTHQQSLTIEMESNKQEVQDKQSEDYIISSDAETEVWEGENYKEDFQQEKKYKMSVKFEKLQIRGKIRTLKQELLFVRKKIKQILLQQDKNKEIPTLFLLKKEKYSLQYRLFNLVTYSV
jgi:hypothetical protein